MNNLLIRSFRLPQNSHLGYIQEILSLTAEEFVDRHGEYSRKAIDRLEAIIFELEVENFNVSEYKLEIAANFLIKTFKGTTLTLGKLFTYSVT